MPTRTYYNRGRMVSRKIAIDPKVNDLDDTTFLCFLMMIPHLDAEGRLHGDPVILKGICFPKRDWTTEQIDSMLNTLQAAKREDGLGLIERYTAKGIHCLWMAGFESEQINFRKDHEAKGKYGYSDIPNPPKSLLKMWGGTGKKKRGTPPATSSPLDEVLDPKLQESVKIIEETFGKPLKNLEFDTLKDILDTYDDADFKRAVEEAKIHEAHSPIKYIETCLEAWAKKQPPVEVSGDEQGLVEDKE